MKRLPALLAAVLAVLLCAACGGTQAVPSPTPSEQTPAAEVLPLSLPYYESASLHPITGRSRTNLTLTPLVYEGLFEVDNTFSPTAVLAERWQSDAEQKVWTFRLKAACFSDASALTGADVVYSLNLARQCERYADRLKDIVSVTADGDSVTVTLQRGNGALPALLDIPIVRERADAAAPLGTGYYAYQETEQGLVLQGTAGKPEELPERIFLSSIQEADDLVYAFDTRDVSLVTADLTGAEALGFSGGYEIWDHPTTTLVYLGFRTDSGACADAALRRAVTCVLNREEIVTALYARHARASVLPISPVSGAYDADLAGEEEYSLRRGAEILEEAGYTLQDGILYQGRRRVSLKLIVSTDNSFRLSAAENVAQTLSALGISVTVEKLSWQSYCQRLEKGSFDLYLAETMLTADFDLESLIGSAGTLNYSRWQDGETDTLLDAYRAASGSARKQAASDLCRQVQTYVPISPICFKEQTVLTQWGQFTGLSPTRANAFAGWSWSVSGTQGEASE